MKGSKQQCQKTGGVTIETDTKKVKAAKNSDGGIKVNIAGDRDRSILDVLRQTDISVSAVCAGKGNCGKCRIRVLKGTVPCSEADKKVFTKQEIAAGYRLACTAYPETDCIVEVDSDEEGFVIPAEKSRKDTAWKSDGVYGIAVDIGTTTVVMQLADMESGEIVDVYTSVNRQRIYGADVISRIQAANEGRGGELRKCIQEILQTGINAWTGDGETQIDCMVIGANTTMVHLLMGYSCKSLGVFPFQPVTVDLIQTTHKRLLGEAKGGVRTFIMPGVSAYVGGDITAGLYGLHFGEREKVSILVDLGTNGEMAIGNRDRILAASVAAGPAFEGGNMVCGVGSIPGAICKVTMDKDGIKSQTIGDRKPNGICGTGVVDAVYELIRAGIVDETGRMAQPYFEEGIALSEDGRIRLYQKDIRQIQLAKAAVRAGLETLMLRYGVTLGEVERIYVAGGFGYKMDIHKAAGIGLFAEAWREKIRAVGNSCLQGAAKFLREGTALEDVRRLVEVTREIDLSQDALFQQLYVEHMCF